MQFTLRTIFAVTAAAAVLSWFAFRFLLPNWDLPSIYAGYGLDGHRATNEVSYAIGQVLCAAWWLAAFGAIVSGAAIAAVALVRGKGG